jgi:hypothetical protein
MTVEFTMEQAKRVVSKQGKPLVEGRAWKNYPEDMLWARAVSRLCRRLFPDLLSGMTYTPSELSEIDDEPDISAASNLPVIGVAEEIETSTDPVDDSTVEAGGTLLPPEGEGAADTDGEPAAAPQPPDDDEPPAQTEEIEFEWR